MMSVRTTVDIDEALLERAKRLALKEKQTLAAVVGQALAAYLSNRRAAAADPPFELLVRGKGGARFPSAEEVLLAEEEDDRKSLAIARVKRRATP
jgi:hypothetical protein